jgi:hypothetical protein
VAVLAGAPDKGQAPLGVTFDLTGSTTGANINYDLNPGDGGAHYNPSGYPTQAHTYSTEGTYIATLVVTDTGTGAHSLPAFEGIVVVKPTGALTAVINATPPGGPAPLNVTLDATSTSGGIGLYTFDFDYTNDGNWDVTGNTTGTTPYTYTTNGIYTARVRVTDGASATDEDTVQVTVGGGTNYLVSNLVATPNCGGAPLAVSLDATGTSGGTPPYSYDFDYTDDGSYDITGNSTGTTPNTYSTVANYTARVRVTDSSTPTPQTHEDTASIEVVAALAPQLAATPPCGIDPLTATLDATGTTGGKAPLSYDFDYTDDSSWDVTGNTTGSVSGVSYTPSGPYTARVRVTDSCSTPQTAQATVNLYSANILTPNLTAMSATWVAPPEGQVTLDASGSTGGTPPLEYRFDYDNDGTWDTAWGASATHTPLTPFYTPGFHTPAVEVRDSCTTSQQTGLAGTMFTVNRNTTPFPPHGWHVVSVATGITAHAMSYTGLTLMQGVPVISYYDDGVAVPANQGLWYVEANDPQGNTWQAPVHVLPGAVGVHSSIKDVVGEPAIAFFNQGVLDLEYIRRVGGFWPGVSVVLDAPNCGSWCSMDFIYDDSAAAQLWMPAVSYIGAIGSLEFEWWWHGADVRYIPSVFPPDNLGTAWGAVQIVDTSFPLGYPQFACTSLEYVDYVNNYPLLPPPYTWSPAVSYIALDWDPGPNGLKYSIAVDHLGWNWSRPGFPLWITQTPQLSVGTMTSLEKFPGMPWDPYAMGAPPITPGNGWMPWVSWCTTVMPSPLTLEEANNEPGLIWGAPHQPDPVPQVGDFSSLEMVGPVLGISHVSFANGELRYVDMNGTNPVGWNPAEFPDPQSAPGVEWKWGTYLVENQRYPAISYYYSDPTVDEVRYAVFY